MKKLLIANRGEIACRIMNGARALGIRSVAVYSDADAEALHVRTADEAVCIGGLTAVESYLDQEKIIAACRESGADAVHPGYGFLSENAAFAAAVEKAGIAFVGPPSEAIRLMGDKLEAKRIATAAGVPTIPGRPEALDSAEAAAEAAASIGYPVLLKAQAGGGGRGMRIARSEAECREGFEQAVREAQAAFGDGRVFVEKYVERPRHIEVQILADGHGNAVYLGERECSIQRRHQKVIEEAPSPFVTPELRAAMGEASVSLAKAIQYRSAGTVEFVVDAERNFHLLEMNTRLQVEHPVTEWVAGVDLVQWMLRIAAGEALDFGQDDVRLNGWSMEARICAEDPQRGFLPSAGRLGVWRPPAAETHSMPAVMDPNAECSGAAAVRLDAGVEEGDEASVYYDSLIAKLIVFGGTRDEAAARLARALDEFAVSGPATNLLFLASLARRPRFIAGDLSTAFITEEYPDGFDPEADCPRETAELLATVAVLAEDRCARSFPREWTKAVAISSGKEQELARKWSADGLLRVRFGRKIYALSSGWRPFEPVARCEVRRPGEKPKDHEAMSFRLQRDGLDLIVSHAGWQRRFTLLPPRAARLKRRMAARPRKSGVGALLAPMPGVLVRLRVEEGQTVKAGEELAVIEAMKMENSLRSPQDGKVMRIEVKQGDNLQANQVILHYE